MIVAFDCETLLFSIKNLLPKVVCLSIAWRIEDQVYSDVLGNGDDIEGTFRQMLERDDMILVGHATSYDLGVLGSSYPKLLPLIFKKLEKGLVTDTIIREKLLNVSTRGKLKGYTRPDGVKVVIKYELASLVKERFGHDLTGKEGTDVWRFNYHMLDGKPVAEYPQEAIDYSKWDSIWTLRLWEDQEARKQRDEPGPGSMYRQYKETSRDFALRLTSAAGIMIDLEKKAEIQAKLDEELSNDHVQLLVDSGIMAPAQPERPYARGARDEAGRLKMTKAKPAKICKAALAEKVEALCKEHGITVKMTEPTERFPSGQVCTDSEVMDSLRDLDPVIAQYAHRQELQKLVQELRKITADWVHPHYDVLKETGRTSSSGWGKAVTEPPYPALNIQQQDNRARQMFIAPLGWVLVSCDFAALELISDAQVQIQLFGQSTLARLLCGGIDPHAFMGAQLAYQLHPEFRAFVGPADRMTIYERFQATRSAGTEFAKFWKHWRTFAKPVGLGYPGGLGPKTFVNLAKAQYGVICEEQLAKDIRELWLEVMPEHRDFFAFINREGLDPDNEGSYRYLTAGGFYRAGCSYCAACNGQALQSPGAEGAKLALDRVVRAMYDETLGSCLYGCRPSAFIHDEILAIIPDDEWKHERAMEISRIMVDALAEVMPDLRPAIKAEPCLMRRWDKRATPAFDRYGRLTVWEP